MIHLAEQLDPHLRDWARALTAAVLSACNPEHLTTRALAQVSLPDQPTHILAFGKASVAMTHAVRAHLGDRFIRATVLCPKPAAQSAAQNAEVISPGNHAQLFHVEHPTPTQANINATRALLDHAHSIPTDHAVVVCISGGGSAHLCLPKPPHTLDDIIRTTNELNARGASIHELNAARSKLEQLKSGGLAHHLAHLNSHALVLSDVIGNDPAVIASGPMFAPDVPVPHTIVGSNADAIGAMTDALGATIIRIERDAVGDARQRAEALARRLLSAQVGDAVVMGGETTVDTHGATGVGGPVCECVVGAALVLARESGFSWRAIGIATDGVDGPAKVCGGVLDDSIMAAEGAIERAARALDAHDTLGFLESVGASIVTGATGTNVNDVIALVRTG